MTAPQLFTAAAVIVLGQLAAMLYSTHHTDKRIDDLRSEMSHRFEDLTRYIEARFKALEDRLERLSIRS
jgi:hypothetical protein